MINIIVAYDNVDIQLGTYFEDCKKQLLSTLNKLNNPVIYDICEIPSNNCNDIYINSLLLKNIPNPFIFIAYSHGNEQALYCGGSNYVKKKTNSYLFKNSLFYTTACSAGKELSYDLTDQGCSVFIGYKKENFVFSEGTRREVSILCDNAGIIEFLSNDITIFEAFKKMEDIYTQQIDKLYDTGDTVFAAHLVDAREALVFLGKHNLKKGDFFIN